MSPARQTEPAWFGEFGALSRAPDRGSIAAYRDAVPEYQRADMRAATVQAIGATFTYGVLILFVVLVPAGIPLTIGIALVSVPDRSGVLSGIISLLVAAIVGGVIAITYGRWQYRAIDRELALRGSWSRRWRLDAFARDNGLAYQARPVGLPTVGSVLRAIGARFYDGFSIQIDGRSTVFVNARSDSQQAQAPSGWGVISIALDREVPPLLLVPKGGGATLAAKYNAIGNRKRMSLEGDFNRYFTLYAAAGAEREALYVITPDLMAIVIDHLPGSYVEVTNATLVITTPRPLRFDRRETWEEIESILAIVVPKAARQTRYLARAESPLSGNPVRGGQIWRERFSWLIFFAVSASVILQVIARALLENR